MTVPSVSRTPAVSTSATPAPRRTSTPRRSSVRRARADDFGVNGVSRRSAISTSTMRASRTGSCGKSLASTRTYSSRSATGHLHAGRPAAAHDDVEGPVRRRGRIGGGSLEAVEHVCAQPEGVVEVLEREGVLDDAGHVEVVRDGAGSDDEHVVVEAVAVVEADMARRRGRCRSPGPSARRRCRDGGGRAGRSRGWRGRRSRSRAPPWPPGTAAVGTCGSCWRRPASRRPAPRAGRGPRRGRRSRRRRSRRWRWRRRSRPDVTPPQ